MTSVAVILTVFLRINFQKMLILVHFDNEGTAGTLLVVFKMHGLQQQKTGVDIKSIHFYTFAIMRAAFASLTLIVSEFMR